jgi:trypsin
VASQSRVIGGFPIDIKEAPYQVSIQEIYGSIKSHICGGTLITLNVVITTAHCTYTKSNGLGIRSGSTKWSSGGQFRRVKKVQDHEKFVDDDQLDYDISLLFLESSLVSTRTVRPIRLNEQSVIEEGTMALLTGWGISSVR